MHCEYYVWFAFSRNLCTVMCLKDVLYIKSSRRAFACFFFLSFFFVFFMFWSWNLAPLLPVASIECVHDMQLLHQSAEGEGWECLQQPCWRCGWCSVRGLSASSLVGWIHWNPLIWICLKVSCFHNNSSFFAVRGLPQPHVADVDALSAEQTLRVSWLVNHTSLLGATSELQISQTENHTIVYSVSPEGFSLFTLFFFFSNSKYI